MAHDVGEWLEGLELGKYAEAFAENGIDLRTLPHLTEDDLKELGVLLGHRRLFLAAIASLQDQEGAPQGEDSASEPLSRSEAERRQLTVMFCDLVGSTELSGRLDLEDLRDVMRRYQDAVAGVVARYEGHVAKFLGDGVLAYFGWPQAHEDQAERAVRAGLDAVAAVKDVRLDGRESLQARIGIATGQVIVGDLVGDAVSDLEAVTGETPNLAARLQGMAEPGQIVIGATTRRLIGEAFELEDRGSRALKGFAEAVPMWRVTGERLAESRFEAAHAGRLATFVGREEEVDLLVRRWQQAEGGEGQVVLLSGEAGIGKSRITQTLRERIADQSPMRLRFQCSPHHANSALNPFIIHLERASGIAPADGPDARLDKLEALLSQSTEDVTRVASLFGALLSIPTGDRYPPLGLAPQLQKERTQEALVDQLLGLAARQPVLMIFEDVHWGDPTTLEVLELVIDRVQDARVLGVITHRPEFAPPWHGHSHVTALALNRLGRDQCAAMVPDVAGGKALPGEVLDQIVAKTDGVPLFVEELTKTVIESGILEEKDDRYELNGPLPPLAIPSTLHDSLMARLDRLAPAKEVAQIGAAIGREFSHRLLAEVSPAHDNALNDALGQLVESELVFRRGRPPDATYVFKHALLQDAAYQSLLRSKRQILHRDIAEALEESFPETAETEPEIIAHHYTEAGLADPAVGYWKRAGERDVESCAYSEAIANLDHGLELLEQLPRDASRARREIALRILLGVPLMSREGWASDRVEENYRRACALCEEYGEVEQLFPALWGLWMNQLMRSQLRKACDLADRLLSVGESQNDIGLQLQAHHCQWTSRLTLGQLKETLEHTKRGIELYDPERHHVLTYTYGGHDAGVCARQFESLALWLTGYPERARKRLDAGFELADKLGHLNTLVEVVAVGMFLAAAQRDADLVTEMAEKLFEVIPAGEYVTYELWGEGALGWARYMRGEREEGLRAMQGAVPSWLKDGVSWTAPMIALAAPVISREAQVKTGLEMLEQTLELMHRDEAHWFEAEIHRVTGEVLESDGERCSDEAERSYQRAMEIAQEQGAKMLELRAATNLSQAWQRQGKADDARKLLTDTYNWFSEGFDTPDLKAARLLLDQLS